MTHLNCTHSTFPTSSSSLPDQNLQHVYDTIYQLNMYDIPRKLQNANSPFFIIQWTKREKEQMKNQIMTMYNDKLIVMKMQVEQLILTIRAADCK